MKMLNNFLLPLIIVLVGALFTWWISKERYEVRYALSERIPSSFDISQQEAIQSLEIKNLSSKEVDGLQVVIPSKVVAYKILKNSEVDQVKEFRTAEKVEFVYERLAADSAFRVILKSTGEGVSVDQISVRHSKGSGVPALSKGSGLQSAFSLVSMLSAIFYVGLCINGIRTLAIESLENSASYNSEKTLKRRCPFYVSQEKWLDIREKAIGRYAKIDRYYGDVAQLIESPQCRFLEGGKPEYLSSDEWEAIRVKISDSLSANLRSKIISAYDINELERLLNQKQPAAFIVTTWSELIQFAEKLYFGVRRQVRDREIPSSLVRSMPNVNKEAWLESQEELRKRYFSFVRAEIESSSQPMDRLEQFDITALGVAEQKLLKDAAYSLAMLKIKALWASYGVDVAKQGKPSWMTVADYEDILSASQSKAQFEKDKFQQDKLLKALRSIAAGRSPYTEGIDDSTKAEIVALSEQIVASREKIKTDEMLMQGVAAQVSKDRAHVTRQLEVLNDVFRDPDSVDRVEEYNIPFSAGNWAIIRRVASVMKEESKKR